MPTKTKIKMISIWMKIFIVNGAHERKTPSQSDEIVLSNDEDLIVDELAF